MFLIVETNYFNKLIDVFKGSGAFAHVGRQVIRSILHDGPTAVSAPNWWNKGCGMCYPVGGMVHIKNPLLLMKLRQQVFFFAFEWSFRRSDTT